MLGRIGGDASLSPRGQLYAHGLADYMNALGQEPLTVWTSEMRRTKQTAADIRAAKRAVRALNELDAVSILGLSISVAFVFDGKERKINLVLLTK